MKRYKITYYLYPEKNIEIEISANNEDEAIIFAKKYREGSFNINEMKENKNMINQIILHYKNGNTLIEKVNYVHVENNVISYTVDKNPHPAVQEVVRIPLENVASFTVGEEG